MNISSSLLLSQKKPVLIDTWWNVNTLQSPDAKTDSTVLIDTWWNVNLFKRHIRQNPRTVLIDTWWNVNQFINRL